MSRNQTFPGKFGALLMALGLMCLGASLAQAQVSKGTFTGMVADQSGAIIPGATITITSEATGVSTNVKTNADGLYTVPALLPGFYSLKAEASGFKALVNAHIELTVGYTQRVDFKLELGQMTQTVTVEGQAPLVDTESNRLSELITASQVQNLPLNGRNVFQMINLAPGAINTTGLITEPGSRGLTTSVVNGARVNMNNYILDGISDKGLSGGSNTQPSVDTVQEFRVDTEALSAEYGSTVGAVTTVVLKSGSNQFHGTAYEFLRNDKLDSREFYEGDRGEFRMNQFGGTLGGPIRKNKWFFFGSYEGERTRVALPQLITVETQAFRNLVMSNAPNSVAALLYKDFPGPEPTPSSTTSLSDYITNFSGYCTFGASCLEGSPYNIPAGSPLEQALLANPDMPVMGTVGASALLHSRAQFYDGNQFSGRIDYQGDKNKVFGRYFFDRYADPYYTPATNGGSVAAFSAVRGFTNAAKYDDPQAVLSWSHTFSPTIINELKLGYNRNVNFDVDPNAPGVPLIYTDTGEVQFGSYNGYPQIFHEEVYQFSDMVTISHGKHTIKAGLSVQRNYENSEFNVARPSYEFTDSVSFAAGQVESVAAGVDPGTIDPATGQSLGNSHLASNIRAWRNWEWGAFINDDWKVTPRFTMTLGLRYDLYTRHTEKYGQVTEFMLPTGTDLTSRMRAVNCYVDIPGATGFDGQPCNGGFQKARGALTTGDHNNFGPRVGFAWDVRGDGKTALRGGFGVSYQGEIYNPLSNSRWDPPFYSFNEAFCGNGTNPPLNPSLSDACVFGPYNGGTPTYTGAPNNLGTGPATATFNAFQGNIMGWYPYNSNGAFYTGIVFPNFRDPYVYGSHLSLEHEFGGGFVLKTSWVGTFGHKLYRAEDINRVFGGMVTLGGVGPTTTGMCGLYGAYRVNCLFGRMRTWENSVNSNYNGLQVVLDKRMSHGFELHTNYTYSHSLDQRSTWHSGATTSNGAAEGFSMDQAHPGLDYGSSIFDVRHAFTTSFVWQMPWYKSQEGFTGHMLGGWQVNSAITLRGGFPWTPYCSDSSSPKACDFNQDGISNDRPNQPTFGNSWSHSRAAFEPDHSGLNLNAGAFWCGADNPVAGCTDFNGTPFDGNLGRNTFRGPNFQEVDLSLFKNIKTSERTKLQFRAEAFNLFNRTNLQMPSGYFRSNSLFGLSTATYFPREIQFALKLEF